MSAAAFRLYVLPWTQLEEDDGLLRKITRIALIISLVLGLAVPFIPVPKVDRDKVEELPPRLAQLLLEKQKPKPKPVPKKVEKKKEEKKKEEKKEEKKKEKPKPKEKTEAERLAEARKKAASTGLLAFSDELADLRDKSVKLDKAKPLAKGATEAKTVRRNILTGGPAGSGGIDTSQLSSGVGRSSLEGRETTQVESPVDMVAKAAPKATSGNSGKPSRTYEEVSIIFDRNKGAIYSLYSRALRKDPTLQGKVVLEITIDPSGSVTACRIVSSELNNESLERKLIARVKLLNFGARNVDVMVVTYPIDFLPS
ncbi:TonB family protein [Kaarinaea lacus]